jgi:cytochrome c-type biogenesis protein CcmF
VTAELGHFALILAFLVALVQAVVPLVGASRGWAGWMGLAAPAATVQFLLTAVAFGVLTLAFVRSDFSLALVVANSHSDKPLIYKITGVWGNHEGSMLLWVLILALFGAMVAWFGAGLPPALKARTLAIQSMIAAAFFAFILFTSNPFWRMAVAPLDGRDLNPLLQDPGLALHPPFLYLGYVGLSISFSFAIAALIEGRVDAAWARWVRPWTLAAWLFLTVGIGLGSWWAYYELGWGGFWFWDPVENASFMPWLLAAALLHSAIVVEKRESLKAWTILLAIMAFGFSLIGTFIVRSGVITSVHAFASDPTRGVFILAILGVTLGAALTLFALRAQDLHAKGVFGVVSRESALVMNNILLSVSALVVFVGTMWPLIVEVATDGERKISVGAPFFDLAFTPFAVALAILLPVGSMLPWKRARIGRALVRLWPALVLALALGALAWSVQTGRSALAPIGIALAAWVVAGAVTDLWARAGSGKDGFMASLGRLGRLPGADWGKAVAHTGFGLTIFGVATIIAWQVEDIRVARPGDSFPVGQYELTMDRVEEVQGPNYIAMRGIFTARRDGREIATLTPEKRIYPVAGMPTTEAAIHETLARDLYVVLGDPQEGGGFAVRSYVKPFANWIWIGTIVMALGAALSLGDRRLRVAPGASRAPSRSPPVPAE